MDDFRSLLPDEMCAEDAVAIQQLTSERDKLRAEVGHLRETLQEYGAAPSALAAQRDMYRLALERVASYFTDGTPNEPMITGDAHGTLIAIRSDVRCALSRVDQLREP